MTFIEHLQELRHRLIICFLAIGVGSVIGWFLAGHVINILDEPVRAHLGQTGRLIVPTIYGAFTLYLKVAIMVGFILALPVTIYQMWAFVAPAFGGAANRWAPIWITSCLVLFVAGGATGYYVVPLAIGFFVRFQGPTVQILPFADQYIGFIALVLVIFGISFELPLVLVSLSAAGITSSRWLSSKRLHFFFGIFIFSTVVTPGADPISPIVLGGILYVLYEIAILVSKAIGR
jgi:sec-independent protein translocase protein TatC